MPRDTHDWTRGPAEADIDIVVWGDYQEPGSAGLDNVLREKIRDLESVRYSFRHFPVNEECNPSTELSKHPLACSAAKAVEAAGR